MGMGPHKKISESSVQMGGSQTEAMTFTLVGFCALGHATYTVQTFLRWTQNCSGLVFWCFFGGSKIEHFRYALDGSWTNSGKLDRIIVDVWFDEMTMVVQVSDYWFECFCSILLQTYGTWRIGRVFGPMDRSWSPHNQSTTKRLMANTVAVD